MEMPPLDPREYDLGEEVHAGTETRLFRAIHRPTGDRVVIKLPVEDAASARRFGRLLHEAEVLVKLAGVRGVVSARALLQHAGAPALVLDDPGFRSLDRVLAARGRLSLEAALRVGVALARVLEGVHAAGVIHKDIKPQNLLVDDSWDQVVLLDFGIASALSEEATSAGIPEALEGTLAYLSPEQTGRTARTLDARSDLYSMGVLLHELLAGRRPFLEKDPLALVHAHLAKAPPPLDSAGSAVPPAVARLVERCLEKHPEERYQTARGLAEDLSRCLRSLLMQGRIDPFPLGEKDFSPALQIPGALVGRERERAEIVAAFERAAAGDVELLLLGGPSGVGKTALVRSVYQDIARKGSGVLLSGKHDQVEGSLPYSAIAQAIRGLMIQLAESPRAVFDAWRARLGRALGPLARVIADLVPELLWLLGPLPPLPDVPTEMGYNRVKLAWIELVRVVTDASPPLVLFLDDAQWADPASLSLLRTLLTDVGKRHLLVIAAFRDGEVGPEHPLWGLARAVGEAGVRTPRLAVEPLSEAAVATWLSGALRSDVRRVEPLARALWGKTHGNPFFLEQLLLELHRKKHVSRDLATGEWQWDQGAVERAAVSDNVAELMLRRAEDLPEGTREILGQAACLGHGFSLEELSLVSGRSREQAEKEIWPALVSGLVIPEDGRYRAAHALAHAPRDRGGSAGPDARYLFLHDRVQQAFYERIAGEQRARAHLQIGRRLQGVLDAEGGSPQRQIEAVRHLNLGAAALASEAERRDLARVNAKAAKAAKASGSYRLQAALVEQALALLGDGAAEEEPQLAVELALERVEADFMLREFEEVHRRAERLLALPLPAPPRLAAQELRVRTCLASGQFARGFELGLAALAEHGITYPEGDEACIAELLARIAECDQWLDARPEGFGAMPAEPSVELVLRDAIEAALMLCAVMVGRPPVASLTLARNVHRTTGRGTLTPASPFFIAALAHARSSFLGDYRGGGRWAREGEEAAVRLASPFLPECACIRGHYIPYEVPADLAREHYRTALNTATASGSFQGMSWARLGELYLLDFWRGVPLGRVAEAERAQREAMARSGDALGQHYFEIAASFTALLRAPGGPPGEGVEWLSAGSVHFDAVGDVAAAQLARVVEAHLFLAFGEPARALERIEVAERLRPVLGGTPPAADIPLWRGLAAAGCLSPAAPGADRAALLAALEHSVDRMRYFAEGCAESFLHKLRLLEAERARVLGDAQAAMTAYDQAMEHARAQRYLHVEAMAAQLAGGFHLGEGRREIGAFYLQRARSAYEQWGAPALVAHLEARHPGLVLAAGPGAGPDRAGTTTTTTTTTTTDSTGGARLDIDTALRAAQALSSELHPDRVVGRLMELTLENAGAQRGALVLRGPEGLSVAARVSVEGASIETGLSVPLAHSRDLAITVVEYVARTGEGVTVADAKAEARFAGDPYLGAQPVRSILALPLTCRGQQMGVLYLEHRDTPGAFPAGRVQLLSVLASQAAISLENARHYDEVERRVAERTRQLTEAQRELMDVARRAGMAEIATNVLHNVGNVLNSVSVSASMIQERLRGFSTDKLAKVAGLLAEMEPLLESEKGKLLPAYLGKLAEAQESEREAMLELMEELQTNVEDIRILLALQQDYATGASLVEEVHLPSLIDSALKVGLASMDALRIEVTRDYRAPASLLTERSKLQMILVNVFSNAAHAMRESDRPRALRVRTKARGAGRIAIEITDSGAGIAPENLIRIFERGFTTRKDGHGFGLHASANAATEMGGQLRAASEGPGRGATFVLELPLRR